MRAHLASLVEEFRSNGDEIAVVMHRGVRRHATTYEQLAQIAGRFSAELTRRGIAPGERIVIWAQNSAEWIGVFFGCLLRGVLAVPLDAAGSASFAQNVIQEVTPRLIVADPERGNSIETKIPLFNMAELGQLLPPAPDFTVDLGVKDDTPFQIIFTSGTTSEPKGIVHTHRNILANLRPIENEICKYRPYERLVHPLRFLHTLPFSHVFGQFMGLWIPAILSAEVHLVDVIESQRTVSLIQRQHINVLIAVPRILGILHTYLAASHLVSPADVDAASKLSIWARWWRFRAVHRAFGWRFWAVISGGAPLPADLELFWNGLGFALIQGYGMTETAALVTLNHPFRIGRGTIGRSLAGSSVKLSETGELMVKGDMVANATWQHGELRKNAVDWLATGDLATQDPSGEFRFIGRKGEAIVTSSGLKIFPVDLESAMIEQPGVRDCAVVPCNFAAGPEPVCILIFEGSDSDLQNAVSRANVRLAPYQQIRRVLRWPQLAFPYTSTGKLIKRQVADWASRILRGERSSASAAADPIQSLISSITGEPTASPDSRLRLSEDLHLDSLGRMQLASMLEQTTGIPVSDAEISKAETIGDLRGMLSIARSTIPTPSETSVIAQLPPQAASLQMPAVSPPPFKNRFPRWPWLFPFNFFRTLFLETVVRPLVGTLLAPRITAPANLPPGPMLIVANHVSVLDSPIILYALPFRLRRRIAIAMSGELLNELRSGRMPRPLGRLLGPLAYLLTTALFNVFPMPRLQGFRESFGHAGEAIDRNYSVLLFPEGTRSATGKLAPFRGGIGLLAMQAEVPVLPVALVGLEQISPRRNRWFRSGALQVNIGIPIVWKAHRSASEWTEILENCVRELHG